MKKHLVLTAGFFSMATAIIAQIPEDVLKYSWQPPPATARIAAIGGAMGALGGDISATFINPAGIGFYKTSDFVISPGLNFNNNKTLYFGENDAQKKSAFNLGTTGYVGGSAGGGNWTSKAFSLAVTRSANFNNNISYSGFNDYSSFAEPYATTFANSGVSLDNFMNSDLPIATKMALYNYMIDTASYNGGTNVISMAMFDNLVNDKPLELMQRQTIQTSGGITELALAFAGNKNDRFYIGGTVGLPIVRYERTSILREEDASGNTNNNFNYAEMLERTATKGMGLNLKLGVIGKVTESLRLGGAIHSPTWYSLNDTYYASLSTNLENYYTSSPGLTRTVTSRDIYSSDIIYRYELTSPWKFIASASYVLNESEDVKQQKGFISADVEYVTHKSNRYRDAENYGDGYYDFVNDGISNYYKNAVNFRVGGELKFNTIMTRLGFAHYGNPYADKVLKAGKSFISGGLGYRNAGVFIDLTYVRGIQKDVHFPYRMDDKANMFGTHRLNSGNLMLTLGFKI